MEDNYMHDSPISWKLLERVLKYENSKPKKDLCPKQEGRG
tara:strand:+ start:1809 stop:1928 length:120 start_codon:yes stop_codon:yes gene_type:complete